MGAKVSSYLQIPNDEFSQGGAGTGQKYHGLANPCTRISEAYSKKKHKRVCLAERRLPVLTAAAAARFGCQPEARRKILPSAKM